MNSTQGLCSYRLTHFLILFLLIVALLQLIASAASAQISDPKGNEMPSVNQQSQDHVRFVAPWEPHRAVVLALPLELIYYDTELQEVFTTLIRNVTEYCDVIICYSYRERDLLPHFIELYGNDSIVSSNAMHVEFIESEVNSFWVRDFGPNFGVHPDGSITLFDNRYENLSEDSDELKSKDPRTYSESDWEELNQINLNAQHRKENSLTNGYIAAALQYLYNMDVSVEKTDISIQGGDFMYMGNGRFLTGESTILLNHTSRRELIDKMKQVFGFTEVSFLPNLPGSAANHLDMNMMVIDEKNVILNEVPLRNEKQRVYMDYLYNHIEKINTYTEKFFEDRFPEVTLHRIPSLPIIPDSQDQVITKLWNIVFDRVGKQIGVVWDNVRSRPENDKQKLQIRTMIMKEIVANVGPVSAWDKDDISKVLRFYFDTDFEKEDSIHAERITFYRTYANSLFVRSIEGKEAFILPRYKGRNAHESMLIPELEKQVEAAYRAARASADIRWLNVDPIIDKLGAIHCFTSTIPFLQER